MTDPISAVQTALQGGSASALPLAFGAGIATSAGPCVAPRFAAVAALSRGGRRYRAYAFVAGLVAAYAALGLVTPALRVMFRCSPVAYCAIACALLLGGVLTVVRPAASCRHDGKHGAGALVVLGAAFGFVVSPCCMPVLAAALAYAANGNSGFSCAVLGAYGAGHAVPLLAAAAGGEALERVFVRERARRALQTTAGGLMVALGAYYACLA